MGARRVPLIRPPKLDATAVPFNSWYGWVLCVKRAPSAGYCEESLIQARNVFFKPLVLAMPWQMASASPRLRGVLFPPTMYVALVTKTRRTQSPLAHEPAMLQT